MSLVLASVHMPLAQELYIVNESTAVTLDKSLPLRLGWLLRALIDLAALNLMVGSGET